MKQASLSFYERFARMPWPRSYQGKFLLVAFIGTHVPLLATAAYVFASLGTFENAWTLLGTLLAATVVGTAVTLVALHHLLRPLPRTAHALRRYADERTPPDLPTAYDDDAGRLMRDTQATLTRLDQLIRFKDRLFNMVLHDVRSPASSVLLAADALADEFDALPPARHEAVDDLLAIVRSSTRQQLAFTRTLLEHVQHDTVQMNIQLQPVSPAALLERAAKSNRLAAQRRGVHFEMNLDEGGRDDVLRTDARLCGQVLQNLVTNAVAFSPRDSQVLLGLDCHSEHVVFSIRDYGEGIDPEELERLFNPFQTGSSRAGENLAVDVPAGPPAALAEPSPSGPATEEATAPAGEEASAPPARNGGAGGFGLGLWIAQTLTRLLGGALDVDSTPGEGSTFRVTLPRRADERSR